MLSGLPYGVLADVVLVLHLGFVLFVVLGGLLVLRWPGLAWLHVPAAAWGTLIEFSGGICPLTPLEQRLRRLGGEAGYSGEFIDHYVRTLLYPEGLTRGTQFVLGAAVLVFNVAIYWLLVRRLSRQPGPGIPRR
jgi:hypothetical protein